MLLLLELLLLLLLLLLHVFITESQGGRGGAPLEVSDEIHAALAQAANSSSSSSSSRVGRPSDVRQTSVGGTSGRVAVSPKAEAMGKQQYVIKYMQQKQQEKQHRSSSRSSSSSRDILAISFKKFRPM